jgi:phospholipase/carboxylesterase
MSEIIDRTFAARLDCHYLLQAPDHVDERTPLVVTLHGFGGKPESMLKLTERLFDAPPVIAALQGPYQFFPSANAGSLNTRDVGYGWITSRRPSESICLHHEMVRYVLEHAGTQFGIPAERRLLVGFSQSVALNYRFAAAHEDAIQGVIAICGGLPADWGAVAPRTIRASVLHIAARQDEYYPLSATESYPERLGRHAADVEFHLIDGGHWMPPSAGAIVGRWLSRVNPGKFQVTG